ncbi:proline-specific peptidase [Armillaria gallica]|uniref:Proline-specific peptidase n=1 Tax=Armillaria gallica TaxID=47427 RepID=A0A2H3CQ97_ARMGA|nr:proline-specific peptidase [Armillaria gallica]
MISHGHRTWYKVVGNLDGPTRTPLCLPKCLSHRYPLARYDYLLPLSDLATKFSIPVIFYDQIGNSRSTHLPSQPPSFWTIDLFIDELVNLLEHFQIQDNFDFLGHSWGRILGLEFEVRRQPEGLRHLVLTNSLADMGMWNASTGELSKAFPDDALRMFHKRHGCLVDPWPEELVCSMNQSISPSADISVAVGMFMGELCTLSIIDRLDRVRVPTFVINGRADIAQDFVVEPLFRGIRQVKWVTMEKSSHTLMWEERKRYMDLVNGFLST